jgi:hypothetical protein
MAGFRWLDYIFAEQKSSDTMDLSIVACPDQLPVSENGTQHLGLVPRNFVNVVDLSTLVIAPFYLSRKIWRMESTPKVSMLVMKRRIAHKKVRDPSSKNTR